MTNVTIYTDGACSGNPGPGGYAAILVATGASGNTYSKTLIGGERSTTNNRMELQAVIVGLSALKRRSSVTIVTDSRYVELALGNGNMKANVDLVERLRAIAAGHNVAVERVAGHSGHEWNEKCDQLARQAIAR